MKQTLWAVSILALAMIPLNVPGQDRKKVSDKELAEMMQKKLRITHSVLDGVAVGDFQRVTHGSDELIRLAKSETWQLSLSPRYEMHSAEFIRATERLRSKAREKNMDGVALAYVEMTLSCLRCHQSVREQQPDGRLDLNLRPPPQ